MGSPDGAHTHGSGNGLGLPVAIGGGALLLAAAMPVILAIIHVLLIALAVLTGTAVAGVTAFAAFAYRRHRADDRRGTPRPVPQLWQATQPHPVPGEVHRPALGRPQEVHQHIHLHGLTADEIAAILRAPTPKEN